jgi:hypothetical protein
MKDQKSKLVLPTIKISKDNILKKYFQMDDFFKSCINALYGDSEKPEIKRYLPKNIINDVGKDNDLSCLNELSTKTGVYLFLEDQIPVYIGIGGEKAEGQDLKTRINQELRAYAKKGVKTKYSKDSGATLSKKIQKIDLLLLNKKISPDVSVEKIKTFKLLVICCGDVSKEKDVLKSRDLETVLIALFHPKYNK